MIKIKREIVVFFCGLAIGAGVVYVALRMSEAKLKPNTQVSEPFSQKDTGNEKTSLEDQGDESVFDAEQEEWEKRLSELSGDWVSLDGQLKVNIDYRILKFGKSLYWDDVSNRRFLLGRELQFMTNEGSYTLHHWDEKKDSITFIREGLREELTSRTL